MEVHDLVRGDVEFPQRALEDFICVKGNGKPLFVLANAVDDRTMAISHVIRGEDQLPTTPRQIMLWGALNAAEGVDLALPTYAHLPLLVNEQGKKLSKRRDPVAVEMYREQGYLPAAFRNYLALLGWSPGDEEIVPLDVILERFRLEDVQRSPAFFDVQEAVAHERRVPPRPAGRGLRGGRPSVGRPGAGGVGAGGLARSRHGGAGGVAACRGRPSASTPASSRALAAVTQERVTVLGEVPELVDFLFLADAPDDPDSWQKAIAGDEGAAADSGRRSGGLRGVAAWDKDSLHEVTLAIAEAVGRKLGKAQAPIRVAVMGRTRGLPLFDSLAVLGRAETCRRLAAALAAGGVTLDPCSLMLLAPLRWALRIALLVLAVIVLYFAVTFVQVWLTSRQYDPHQAGAILVMGAAQDDCVPTLDLAARLDQALTLYHQGYAHLIMLTGEQTAG